MREIDLAPLLAVLDLSPSSIERRRERFGLDDAALRRLAVLSRAAEEGAGPFLDRLYERLTSCSATAPWLSRADLVERLKLKQRDYLRTLFTDRLSWDDALACVRLSVVHHHVRLPPQWYLATFAHWVADHADTAFAATSSTADALGIVASLLRRVLFETTLVLDAYGVQQHNALRDAEISREPGAAPVAAGPSVSPDAPAVPPPLSRIRVDSDAVAIRSSFVGLDDEVCSVLRELRPAIEREIPGVLARFYDRLGERADTANLVPAESIEPLKRQVASYWSELALGTFDRMYAASRTRIGVVHERIGLSIEHYLVGVALQSIDLIERVAPDARDPRAAVRALVRAVFFDLSFVLDAYMDARAVALLRSDSFASELLAGLTAGVAVVDARLRVEHANTALLTMFGLDAQLVRSTRIDAIVPFDGVTRLIDRVLIDGQVRAVGTLNAGSRSLRATVVPLRSANGPSDGARAALVLDELTDVSVVNENLETLEHGLALITRSIRAVLWEADAETWTLQTISRPAIALTGHGDLHFLGKPGAWLTLLPEPDRTSFVERCRALVPDTRAEFVHRLEHAEGHVLWVRTEVHAVMSGATLVLRGFTVDMTAELREQHNRLAALGRLAGGVAHELNNLLMVITGSLELLEDAPLGIDDHEAAHAALEASHRSAELIRKLLAFAQRQPLHSEPVSLNEVVEDIARSLSNISPSLRLHVELDPTLWLCAVDRRELEGAVRGVIENARDAMPSGGDVTLRTRNVSRTEIDPALASRLADHVELAVNDTGVGMDADVLSHAFEPFYTTKPSSVGLGLSSVHGFVQQSGGHVVVQSHHGQGTVVRLRFPRLQQVANKPLDPGDPRARVLVVDDEPSVRRVLVRLLAKTGVLTLEASTANEALAILDATAVDLLVTDVMLGPGLSGSDLGRIARAKRPGLPVIYVSGFTRAELNLDELGKDEWFLPKPFAAAVLRETVRAALPKRHFITH
ncbi:MAG: protoglobin domain-containing protein [Polyangiaceae bacterium]